MTSTGAAAESPSLGTGRPGGGKSSNRLPRRSRLSGTRIIACNFRLILSRSVRFGGKAW